LVIPEAVLWYLFSNALCAHSYLSLRDKGYTDVHKNRTNNLKEVFKKWFGLMVIVAFSVLIWKRGRQSIFYPCFKYWQVKSIFLGSFLRSLQISLALTKKIIPIHWCADPTNPTCGFWQENLYGKSLKSDLVKKAKVLGFETEKLIYVSH
jgi:hypothetical protein